MASGNKKLRVASALLMFSAMIKPSKAYAAGLAEVRQGAIGKFARPSPRSARGAFRRPKAAYSMRGPVHGPTPGSEPIYAAADKVSFAARAHDAPSPFSSTPIACAQNRAPRLRCLVTTSQTRIAMCPPRKRSSTWQWPSAQYPEDQCFSSCAATPLESARP